MRGDTVLFVEGLLFFAAAVGFVDGPLHGVGHLVGVEDGATFDVAGGATDGLDEGALAAKEAFFVGVKDGDEGDLGQVQAFAKEVDADQDVVLAFAEVAEEFDPLESFDLGVHVAAADADLSVVACEVLGHALGEGGDKDALVVGSAVTDLGEEVVDLALDGTDLHYGIDEASGSDDLFDDDSCGFGEFVGARGGRDVDDLTGARFEFFEAKGTIVHCRWEAEAVVDKVLFAAAVAVPHAVELGDGDVGLVDEEEVVAGEVVEERGWRLAGEASGEVA